MRFQELFIDSNKKEVYIVIPKIQREYVQGKNTDVRESFVDQIFKCISNTNREIKALDVIYGKKTTKDGKTIYMPVDGQQRLTTLFLLYWYIGIVEKKASEISFLKRFEYDTRKSSNEFCRALTGLMDNNDFLNRFEKSLDGHTPSEIIRNEYWYYIKYGYDYTVQSMLEMLDCIHRKYNEVNPKVNGIRSNKLFDNLDYLQLNSQPLEDYTMNEQLYVIMNDRGKPLVTFENFYNSFIKWMKSNKSFMETYTQDDKKTVTLETPEQNISDDQETMESDDKKVSRYKKFTYMIDNIWMEHIWKQNKKKLGIVTANAETDISMYRFMCRYLYSFSVIFIEKLKRLKVKVRERNNVPVELSEFCNTKIDEKELFTFFRNEAIDKTYFDFKNFEIILNAYSKYQDLLNFCKEEKIAFDNDEQSIFEGDMVKPFSEFYDGMYNYLSYRLGYNNYGINDGDDDEKIHAREKIKKDFLKAPWKVEEAADILFSEQYSNIPRLINFAFQLLILHNSSVGIDDDEFKYWKRFAWNYISVNDCESDNESVLQKHMLELYEFSKNIKNLNSFLANDCDKVNDNTLKYEIVKAKYIEKDATWLEKFEEAEKHQFMAGYIDFLVDHSILDNKIVDNQDMFDRRFKAAKKYFFDEKGFKKGDDHYLGLRAIISRIGKEQIEKREFKFRLNSKLPEMRNQIKSNPVNSIIRNYLFENDDLKTKLEDDCKKTEDWGKTKNELDRQIFHSILCESDDFVENLFEMAEDNSKDDILFSCYDIPKIKFSTNVKPCAFFGEKIVKIFDTFMNFIKNSNNNYRLAPKHENGDDFITYKYDGKDYKMWYRSQDQLYYEFFDANNKSKTYLFHFNDIGVHLDYLGKHKPDFEYDSNSTDSYERQLENYLNTNTND